MRNPERHCLFYALQRFYHIDFTQFEIHHSIYNPEVAAYVYRENILLTLIGTIVGAGLGKILHLFIIETVEVPAAMFGRTINLPSYIYSFIFTILFSMIVNGVMYFKLRKIDMVESLKSIE